MAPLANLPPPRAVVAPPSAAEASAEQAQLIVTHHQVLFRPVQRLTSDTVEGRMLLGLIKAGVAVYSPHTAFDNTTGGINDILAGKVGLTNVAPLRRLAGEPAGHAGELVPRVRARR